MTTSRGRIQLAGRMVAAAGLLTLFAACGAAEDKKPSQAIPPAQAAGDQAAAIKLAKTQDLPAVEKADRVVIQELWPGKARITVTKATALKQLRAALVVAEVPPSAGESHYQLSFYLEKQLVREVWVYTDGEWGFERPKPPHWTIGRNVELKRLIASLVDEQKNSERPEGRPK
jgi:hypothetical protein